jgi:hypothetical protein
MCILIIGCGVLGSRTLDMLLQLGTKHKIYVAARNLDDLRDRVNLSRLVAFNLGMQSDVEVVSINLENISQTAEAIKKLAPRVIFNATSLQTFWKISELPEVVYRKLALAGVGPWIPMHLSLSYNLMQAVQQAAVGSVVINGSYPDAVNVILNSVGLAPFIGIGNVANTIPALVVGAARILDVASHRIFVRFVAHHSVSNNLGSIGCTGGMPYILRVYLDNEDVTKEIDVSRLFSFFVGQLRRSRGVTGQIMASASATNVILAAMGAIPTRLHCPGPLGLPGGYPVVLFGRSVSLDLPSGVDVAQAIEANQIAGKGDGIESIDNDGTVTITDKSSDIMHDVLGFKASRYRLSDCWDLATEIKIRYAELCSRCLV